MKVVVASQNPVKLAAVERGFKSMFKGEELEVVGVAVESGVNDQPQSDEETIQGAYNRAEAARQALIDADYWVGVEGGIEIVHEGMFSFAWVVVFDGKYYGRGRSGGFELPPKVAELIKEGMELGDADDVVFGIKNSKQKNGSVGLLTNDVLTRETLYLPAVVLALIAFVKDELYRD